MAWLAGCNAIGPFLSHPIILALIEYQNFLSYKNQIYNHVTVTLNLVDEIKTWSALLVTQKLGSPMAGTGHNGRNDGQPGQDEKGSNHAVIFGSEIKGQLYCTQYKCNLLPFIAIFLQYNRFEHNTKD
jgi:hypothetical protein